MVTVGESVVVGEVKVVEVKQVTTPRLFLFEAANNIDARRLTGIIKEKLQITDTCVFFPSSIGIEVK